MNLNSCNDVEAGPYVDVFIFKSLCMWPEIEEVRRRYLCFDLSCLMLINVHRCISYHILSVMHSLLFENKNSKFVDDRFACICILKGTCNALDKVIPFKIHFKVSRNSVKDYKIKHLFTTSETSTLKEWVLYVGKM